MRMRLDHYRLPPEDSATYASPTLPHFHTSCAAYHNDILVGAITARSEKQAGGKSSKMYIVTLGVLAPYRDFGIGGAGQAEDRIGVQGRQRIE